MNKIRANTAINTLTLAEPKPTPLLYKPNIPAQT
jgi:hypothetical protein